MIIYIQVELKLIINYKDTIIMELNIMINDNKIFLAQFLIKYNIKKLIFYSNIL